VKILVVGGGGREHALVWKLRESPTVTEIIAAPGNAGVAELARCLPVAADDIEGLTRLALEERCDLTVVGPEIPLSVGIADRFAGEGLAVFGPSRSAARLEGSKRFAKELMLRAGIPTARAWATTSRDEAISHVRELGIPVVIKADGLAAGKGVMIATSEDEAISAIDAVLTEGRFGAAGSHVLVEEYLEGEEASILAFTDGRRIASLVPSQDHKRAFDGDRGPNTGGMGAYAPAPVVDKRILADIERDVIMATVRTLADEYGTEYRGVLYAGLMITDDGPKVLEFNCRFGDPETQVVLPLLDGDLAEIMMSVATGELDPSSVGATDQSAACVVMASGGYPGAYKKGRPIHGLKAADAMEGVVVFHAGTADSGGATVTAGGRVLGVTGVGPTLPDALDRAYAGVGAISFDDAHHRTDIAHRALEKVEGASAGGRDDA
jgi:phosphoribosylamine--glycine ligase